MCESKDILWLNEILSVSPPGVLREHVILSVFSGASVREVCRRPDTHGDGDSGPLYSSSQRPEEHCQSTSQMEVNEQKGGDTQIINQHTITDTHPAET